MIFTLHTLTASLVFIPLATAVLLFIAGFRREKVISNLALATTAVNSLLTCTIIAIWFAGGREPLDLFFGPLVRIGDYHFDLSFQIDRLTVVFLFLTAFISGIVVKYSQYYMHREPGYNRFFVNTLIFIGGMNLLSLAGTLDLLFAGWEIVGISSFLLIAFYRDRLHPARHALRTYSVYRFCDTGLLVGAWLSHLVWHASPTFSDLASPSLQIMLRHAGEGPLLGLTLLTLLAAAGKSAQFPFTFWIPRAMEGPTPSSAVFYGALSIHAGAFLLMRMFPVWNASIYGPYIVGTLGFTTAVISTLVGHAQSNIKGQIAYASSAQVGLIFVELALGWEGFALFHLSGNAFLRCFQLLISPSIIAFVLRWQGLGGGGVKGGWFSIDTKLPRRWVASLYVFCLCEGYLEQMVRTVLWKPVCWIGAAVGRLAAGPGTIIPLAVLVGIGISVSLPVGKEWGASVLVALAVGLSSGALASWGKSSRAWDMATLAGVCMAGSIYLFDHEAAVGASLVIGSNFVGWGLGRWGLARLTHRRPYARLHNYQGMVQWDGLGSFLVFIGFLIIAGFPISPGFVGEDLLLHSTIRIGSWATCLLALVFAINGLALCRVFVRSCFAGSMKVPMEWNWESSQTQHTTPRPFPPSLPERARSALR